MTNKERVQALLNREKPDRVPIYPFSSGFSLIYAGHSIADMFAEPEIALLAQQKTAEDFDWVWIPGLFYAAFGGWEFGGEIKWPTPKSGQAPALTRHPVETPEDALNLEIPDVARAGIIPMQRQFCDLAAREDHPRSKRQPPGHKGTP